MATSFFPTQRMTWKVSRTGLSDIISLQAKGHPYTIAVDKQSGGYRSAVFYSTMENPSAHDSGAWVFLPGFRAFDTVDIPATTVPADARSIVVRTDAITEPLTSKNPLQATVVTSSRFGANNKRPASSGNQDLLLVSDDYEALILNDMVDGSFFPMQDAVLTNWTDAGPKGLTDMDTSNGVTDVEGPFGITRAFQAATTHDAVTPTQIGFGSTGACAMEIWDNTGDDMDAGTTIGVIASVNAGNTVGFDVKSDVRDVTLTRSAPHVDPGEWTLSTAYSVGDRVTNVASSAIMECEVAGTSAATEPTWPANGTTVVDNGIVWRRFGSESSHGDASVHSGSDNIASELSNQRRFGRWNHTVAVMGEDHTISLYLNGTLTDVLPGLLANTSAHTFGSPFPVDKDGDMEGDATLRLGNGPTGTTGQAGKIAFGAFYLHGLTAAQVKSHFDTGVALGLNE